MTGTKNGIETVSTVFLPQENKGLKESEDLLESAARFYYSSQAELITLNFYPIAILVLIAIVGKKSLYIFYNFPPKFQCYGP